MIALELDRWADDGGSYLEEGWEMDLDGLRNDGDTIDLEDGRKLRLKIEPDDINPFDEFDTYGKTAPLQRNSYGEGDRRPDGFDGNAEKLTDDSGYGFWWQPPGDVKRTDEHFPKLRRLVIDLASYGCVGVTLELLKDEDAYGRPIVRNVASLWGIDSLADGYLAVVVGELAAELELTA